VPPLTTILTTTPVNGDEQRRTPDGKKRRIFRHPRTVTNASEHIGWNWWLPGRPLPAKQVN
jgi:hypothetical protein